MWKLSAFLTVFGIAVALGAVRALAARADGRSVPTPSDQTRTLRVDGRTRSYIIHVPPKLNPKRPAAVVLALHGAATNGAIMALSTGLNAKADEAGFVVVYPNGTGKGDVLLVWNAGGWHGPNAEKQPDDVKFLKEVLDDLPNVVKVDPKRVYATGMSNGGMMCYRLAAELSDRIAAIAPVSGTLAVEKCSPKRPVPVLHFHGTDDKLVPFNGPQPRTAKVFAFKSVDETIGVWTKIDGCPAQPKTVKLPHAGDDGTSVERKTYGPGKDGAEVVLYVIHGGGHTWPGRTWPVPWLGKTTKDVSASDLMWEFFKRHPMTDAREPAVRKEGTDHQ
jgi:polyhydroxybutyrate depolymerase